MCVGCPDFVDFCAEGSCNMSTPEKFRGTTFYLDSTLCEHLAARYGTTSASHLDHFRRYHTGPDCECISGNWYPGMPEPTIPEDEDA